MFLILEILNTQVITDNPSFNGYDNCNYPTPGTTNFIANIDDCVFTRYGNFMWKYC